MGSSGNSGEFERISRYFAPLSAAAPLAFGLTDDAALLRPEPGYDLVATTDCMVEGVHFFPDDDPADIAGKLLRTNLSDLAAMGARPRGYLLTAAWRRDTADDWIAAFAEGLRRDQTRFATVLLGGDTVATPGPLSFNLVALGEVEAGAALRRNGAEAGEGIYVSGWIGDAGLGLALRRGELAGVEAAAAAWLLTRHRLPEPRLALGRGLVGLASAALDISDGLLADLGHICAASGTGADIAAAAVPLSPAARSVLAQQPGLLPDLLTAGDDYELCFTVPPVAEAAVARVAEAAGVPVTRIGWMTSHGKVVARDAFGAPMALESAGYRHF